MGKVLSFVYRLIKTLISFLSGAEGLKDTLTLQIRLAKLICLSPKGSEKGAYLLSVAEQAYHLLQASIERNDVLIVRSAVLILSRISEHDDSRLMQPVLQGLAATLSAGVTDGRSPDFDIATRMAYALVSGISSIISKGVVYRSFSTSRSVASRPGSGNGCGRRS